ncbi:MAG: hypothetical protein ACI8TQ_001123 [Planctomycetota bacterium]|jgi:hypothetical protein
MIASALITLVPLFAVTPATPKPAFALIQDGAEAEDYETKLAKAGDNVEELLALQVWCRNNGKIKEARACLKKIVKIDPNHKEARKALGHHFYDEQWFESYFSLTDYKGKEEKRMLDEKGLVRFQGEWVPVADEPYLKQGMVRESESGEWLTKRELDRRTLEAKYKNEGWTQLQYLVWVSPEELPKAESGLVKCGDEWLDLEAATDYRSKLDQWWTVRSENNRFEIWSTCPWTTTYWAGWHADQTFRDLARAFGTRPDPKKPPVVAVLNSPVQYNLFAAGANGVRLPTEAQGFSSLHYAYFAETWFLPTQPPEYLGTGVALWNMNSDQKDSNGNPDPFGKHAVRHAAALAYAEAIDPSPETLTSMASSQGQQNFPTQRFWGEKKIPSWFRVGVAAYCERYFIDPGENPYWARDWSLDNIRRKGGPMKFDEIFKMQLNPNDVPGSSMRINQAGMLVSFILDGKCEPVMNAHLQLTNAIREGTDTAEADAKLRKAIIDNEEDFHIYVKM